MYHAPVTRPHTCSFCDKSFTRRYDLKRHYNTIHPESTGGSAKMGEHLPPNHSESETEYSSSDTGEEEEDAVEEEEVESSTEKIDGEEEEEEEEEESSTAESTSGDPEDNTAFQCWYQEALIYTKGARDAKYQKYIDRGMDEGEAKEKAYAKTLWALQRVFFEKYTAHLWSTVHIQDNDTHLEIVEDLEQRMVDRKDADKTLKRVMAKHRRKFDSLFLYDDTDESEEDMDDANDD